MTASSMRLLFSCLILALFAISSSPSLVWGGSAEDLGLIEGQLDKVLERELSPRQARDFTYQLLNHIEGWLKQSDIAFDTAPILIRIFSKARGLNRFNLSLWDQSFLNLISSVVFGGVPVRDKAAARTVDGKSLKKRLNELLSQIKAEELYQIKKTTLSSSFDEPSSASKSLIRVASWLSSIQPPRELTMTEKEYLSEIVLKCQNRSHRADLKREQSLQSLFSELNPAFSFRSFFWSGKFRNPVLSESVEARVHALLETGPKLTQSLKRLDELGPRKIIFDFLSEDEARSQSQINREWRAIVHGYERRKGYPSSQLPKEKASFEDRLQKTASLSQEEKNAVLQDSESLGFGEHRAFLYSIHRVCLNAMINSKLNQNFNHLQQWQEELKFIAPQFSQHSELGHLVQEILALKRFDVLNLSEAGKEILNEYRHAAQDGNIYAQQTIKWIRELNSLGTPDQRFFGSEPPSVSIQEGSSETEVKLPESFPDIHLYSKWKEALKVSFLAPLRGDYTQEAALARLYRDPYLRFIDPVLFSYIQRDQGSVKAEMGLHPMDLRFNSPAPEGRVAKLKEQARYYRFMRKNTKRRAILNQNQLGVFDGSEFPYAESTVTGEEFRLREAFTYASSGNTQHALAVLKERAGQLKKDNEIIIKDNWFTSVSVLYDSIAAAELNSELLDGKDEITQKRIRQHSGVSLENIQLISHLKNKPYLNAANVLSSRNFPSVKKPNRIETIKMLYWIGAAKEAEEISKMEGGKEKENQLSLLDSIIHSVPPHSPTEAPETTEAKEMVQERLELRERRSGDRLSLFEMLIEMGRLSDITHWLVELEDLSFIEKRQFSNVYFQLKDYKTALIFFERHEADLSSRPRSRSRSTDYPIWLTKFAQAYFQTEDYQNTLRILAKKKELNFADHELRIGALTHLMEEEKLREAVLAKEQHERSVLLPDLREAARIYEEDGDLNRAKQILSKACKISRRLGDEAAVHDEEKFKRVNLK